uniref:N5-carboxyaminoimidazole ribonucleotide mutase n=1 Tax=candidate division WOR-3 bacterium TaxID=2052148 RepID=A0A7C4YHH7_UNCW3
MADILLICGSERDIEILKKGEEILKKNKISYDIVVSSAHREPERTRLIAKSAKKKGYKVIIAAAGLSAALPGFISSLTDLPVIGVPLAKSTLGGIDSLLSIVQMPKGVPVLSVGIDGIENAVYAAIRILGVSHKL